MLIAPFVLEMFPILSKFFAYVEKRLDEKIDFTSKIFDDTY